MNFELSSERTYRGEKDFCLNFEKGGSSLFHPSDGWCNGHMFNVFWRKENVTFGGGSMGLVIDKDAAADVVPYSGGEYRSFDFYGYGKYETVMKAIKNDGVVSSFFVYTGESDNNPWDEIDIEILGRDTSKVQFNFFTDGMGDNEYLYDLGFDASEDFHRYGFEWKRDKIIWYVDKKPVYSADKNIPVTRGRIMMNAWCGTGVDEWLKPFSDDSLPLAAEYKEISFIGYNE